MEASNFHLLQSRWLDLYEHAHLAEKYAYPDPHTAVIKLRCFTEVLVGIIFKDLRLPSEPGDGFFEKLESQHFKDLVGPAILQKLHAVRLLGNKAAHGQSITLEKTLYLIEETNLIGHWFNKTYSGDLSGCYPSYLPPLLPTEPIEAPDGLKKQLGAAKRGIGAFGGFGARGSGEARIPKPIAR